MSKKKTKDGSKAIIASNEPTISLRFKKKKDGKVKILKSKKTKKSKKPRILQSASSIDELGRGLKNTTGNSPNVIVNFTDHSTPCMTNLMSQWSEMVVHEPCIVYQGPIDSDENKSKDAKDVTTWDALGLETKRDIYERFNNEFRNYYSMLYSYDKMNYIMNVIDRTVNDDLLMEFKFNKQKTINRIHRVVSNIEGL